MIFEYEWVNQVSPINGKFQVMLRESETDVAKGEHVKFDGIFFHVKSSSTRTLLNASEKDVNGCETKKTEQKKKEIKLRI